MDSSEAAPAVATEAQSTVQSAPIEAAPAQDAKDEKDPHWLPSRLERERRTILKMLGVDNVSDAKAGLEELKKRRDADKTEHERLRAENAELAHHAKQAADFKSIVASQVETELASMPEDQRKLVEELAGDDVAKQLRTIKTLRASIQQIRASAPVAPAPIPAPANTAHAESAPKPAGAQQVDHHEVWLSMKEKNPMMAAQYFGRHAASIVAHSTARK